MPDTTAVPLSANETFCFDCSPRVACFNACCRDLSQALTPYDILRLKSYLGLSSQDFLARYTQSHTGPETGLPIVALKPAPTRDLRCPFVTEAGCSVYDARPASCRTYPLMRGLSRSRETGRITEHFLVLHEPHCRGFEQRRPRTAKQWLKDQGADIYNHYNDRMLALIALKNQRHSAPLGLAAARLFQMALYDLDAFRDHIFNGTARNDADLPGQMTEKARDDDLALLELAMAWVGKKLFGADIQESL